MQLTAGHRRPDLLGAGDALARERDPGRVEAAQARRLVVRARVGVEPPRLAHPRKARRRRTVRCRMGAEEEQVVRQPVGHLMLAAHRQAQLRQEARRDPLRVDVRIQAPGGLGLEDCGGQSPQRGLARLRGAGPEFGAEGADLRQNGAVAGAHQREHERLHLSARSVVAGARRDARLCRHVVPAEVERPQVGRMHAVGRGQLLNRPVLREQHHRRHRLAGELATQEVHGGEGRPLDRLDRGGVELARARRQALHRGLGSTQHRCDGGQADQFECAHALVQVRTRAAQDRRVDAVDVRAADRLGLLQVAAQRLVRVLERAAQLAVHPRQRAQVVGDGGAGGVRGLVHRLPC